MGHLLQPPCSPGAPRSTRPPHCPWPAQLPASNAHLTRLSGHENLSLGGGLYPGAIVFVPLWISRDPGVCLFPDLRQHASRERRAHNTERRSKGRSFPPDRETRSELPKAPSVLCSSPPAGQPPTGESVRAPGAQSGQEASPRACAPPALAPRPCPPCQPGSRSPLRRLPPHGPQAICYIKENSHHTHVPAAPQRRTPREASSPSPPPASATRPVCPATRSEAGLALATPSPSPIAVLVKKNLPPVTPTVKEGVIGNTRSMHKDVPQNECTFLCEKAQRRRRQRLSGAQK